MEYSDNQQQNHALVYDILKKRKTDLKNSIIYFINDLF